MRGARSLVSALVVAGCVASVVLGFAACGGGTQGAPSDASTESGNSVSADVGPAGGTIAACGSVIAIPPGSLTATTTVTLSCDPTATVPGFALASPLYRFEPAGLTFARPATVTLAFAGSPASPAIYWSRLDGSGYDPIASTVQGAFAVGAVTHFSTAFVGKPAQSSRDGGGDATIRDAGTDGPMRDAPAEATVCATPTDPSTVGVPCGSATCTGDASTCCHDWPGNGGNIGLPGGCASRLQNGYCPGTQPGSGTGGIAQGCDGPEDCASGQSCCAVLGTYCTFRDCLIPPWTAALPLPKALSCAMATLIAPRRRPSAASRPTTSPWGSVSRRTRRHRLPISFGCARQPAPPIPTAPLARTRAFTATRTAGADRRVT
jgi:hypothetical protein